MPFRVIRRPVVIACLLGVVAWCALHVVPRWFPQVRTLFEAADPRFLPPAVADLPLVVRPGSPGGPVAIVLSGNAGWWGIDDGLAAGLKRAGMTVVGWNSLAYFVHPRTPESTAHDIDRVVEAFGPDRDVLIVGYSFGADVTATVFGQLAATTRSRVRTIAMLGLSREADYSIGFWKVLGRRHGTVKAVGSIKGPGLLCFQGSEEGARSACNLLDPAAVEIVTVPGGHHFDGDYGGIAARIVETFERMRTDAVARQALQSPAASP